MTSENKEREAFERFIKHARNLEGVFLRDCNDICPDRTYQNPDTDYLWQQWNTRTPHLVTLSEDEAVGAMLWAWFYMEGNPTREEVVCEAYRALIAAQAAPRVSPEVAALVAAARDVTKWVVARDYAANEYVDILLHRLQPFTEKTDDVRN